MASTGITVPAPEVWVISARIFSICRSMKSRALERRSTLPVIVVPKPGEISRIRGMIPRRILLRRYLVERFDESCRKSTRFSWA